MKLTLTHDLPAGAYATDADDGIEITLDLTLDDAMPPAPPVESPPPPPATLQPPPPPPSAATWPPPVAEPVSAGPAVIVSGTFADGTPISTTLLPGQRIALGPSVAYGSAIMHADGMSVCIENAYLGAARDLIGAFHVATDAGVLFDGALTIGPYARTRPLWVKAPQLIADPDVSALPKLGAGATASMAIAYAKADNGPMGIGLACPAFSTTGERPDLGPVPEWDADYLTNPSAENADVVRGMADAAATWRIHAIDPATDALVDMAANPFISFLDATFTTAHQNFGNPIGPVVTGDTRDYSQSQAHACMYCAVSSAVFGTEYDREELAAWVLYYNSLQENPGYRLPSGVFSCQHGQVRGKGRGLTALLYGAALCNEPFRGLFTTWAHNLGAEMAQFYLAQAGVQVDQTGDAGPNNPLGVYMQHILVFAVGLAVDHGFTEFQPVLDYFGQQIFDSILKSPHELATIYNVPAKDWVTSSGTPASDWAQALQFKARADANVAAALQQPEGSKALADALGRGDEPGDFTGYPTSPSGYPAMMQGALAMLAKHATDQVNAQAAWAKFQQYQRIDYSTNPKYNVVPYA